MQVFNKNQINGFTGYFEYLKSEHTNEGIQVAVDGEIYNSAVLAYQICRVKECTHIPDHQTQL